MEESDFLWSCYDFQQKSSYDDTNKLHRLERRWIVPDVKDLLLPSDISSPCKLYSSFIIPLQKEYDTTSNATFDLEVMVEEQRGRGVWDTIGGEIWEAAVILSVLLINTIDLNGYSSFLELGCGLGLPSLVLAASKIDAIYESSSNVSITLTDHDPRLVHELENTIQSNLKLWSRQPAKNGQTIKNSILSMFTGVLDWSIFTSSDGVTILPKNLCRDKVDLVFGSALCYATGHASQLAGLLRYYLQAQSRCKEAIILQIRDREGFSELIQLLDSMSLRYVIEDVSESCFDLAQQVTRVQHRVSRAPPTSSAFDSDSDGEDKVLQQFIYSFPRNLVNSIEKERTKSSNGNLIRSNREAFCILHVFSSTSTHL